MKRIAQLFEESFVPLLAVLVLLLVAIQVIDLQVEELANAVTVIDVNPEEGGWNADEISSTGMRESDAAGSAVDESDASVLPPEVIEAARRDAWDKVLAATTDILETEPDNTAAMYLQGVAYLKGDRLEAALKSFSGTAQRDPKHVRALFNRAVTLSRLKQIEDAESAYRQVIAVQPRHFEAHYNLGWLLLDREQPEGAETVFSDAISLAGGSSRARTYFGLGVAQGRQKKLKEARESYTKAVEFKPAYIRPRFNLALLDIDEGTEESLERARKTLKDVVALQPNFAPGFFLLARTASMADNDTLALQYYERAAQINPNFWKARYNIGIVALRLGRLEQAQAVFEGLILDFPDQPEPHFNLGRVAYRERNYSVAEDHYRHALRIAKNDYPSANLNLGLTLRAQDRLDDALATFDRLIAQEPTNASARLNRGLVLQEQKKYDEARQAFREAIEVRPNYAAAYYNVARLESRQGNRDASIQAYQKALEARPNYMKAALNLGSALASAGRDDEALGVYRKVTEIAPSYAPAYFNLGLALRRLGRDDEAITAYERAVELDPEYVAAYQNLGSLYAQSKRYEDAAKLFQEALDRQPSNVALRYNLALQRRRLGDLVGAENELLRCLRLKPGYEKALLSLASVWLARERPDEVVKSLEAYRAQAGEKGVSALVLTRLGRAYLRLNDLERASALLQEAYTQRENSVEVLSSLAEVATRQGQTERASTLLARATELRPDSVELAERLRALQSN